MSEQHNLILQPRIRTNFFHSSNYDREKIALPSLIQRDRITDLWRLLKLKRAHYRFVTLIEHGGDGILTDSVRIELRMDPIISFD